MTAQHRPVLKLATIQDCSFLSTVKSFPAQDSKPTLPIQAL